MRSQGRNRRSRNHKEVDDPLSMARDDPQVQPYTRHQHSSHYEDPHRPPVPMASRPAYDIGRDSRTAMAARSMREGDWAAGGSHDRYGYDLYHPSHGEHDGYDAVARRGDDGWAAPSGEGRYSSRGGWSHSYHHGEASTSYQDSSVWNPTSPAPAHYNMSPRYKNAMDHSYLLPRSPNPYEEGYDDSYYYEHWRGRDPRPSPPPPPPPPDDRMDYTQAEKRGGGHGWGRGHRNNKSGGSGSGGQKFQSDSGWSGRRKGKESDWYPPPQNQWEEKAVRPAVEDRSWEPAESWKSSNKQDSNTSQSRQQASSRFNTKQHKPTRRGASSGKQKKEKKNEDLNLNNWTRRDTSKKNHQESTSGSRRKRSPSRSRSPESVRSHLSSYRSRSSSPVTKRRRRESCSRSPRENDRMGWLPPAPEDRMPSRSPSPYRSPIPHRRRSPSSDSSARSRSPSPHERRRAVHRLPTANTPAPQTSPAASTTGKSKKNKKNRSKAAAKQVSKLAEEDTATARADTMSMPPPPIPQPVRIDRHSKQSTPDWRESNTPTPAILPPAHGIPLPPKPVTSLSIPASLPEKPVRTGPVKHAGFKPIGQPNSALKMFFPGDDEEVPPTPAREPPQTNSSRLAGKSNGLAPSVALPASNDCHPNFSSASYAGRTPPRSPPGKPPAPPPHVIYEPISYPTALPHTQQHHPMHPYLTPSSIPPRPSVAEAFRPTSQPSPSISQPGLPVPYLPLPPRPSPQAPIIAPSAKPPASAPVPVPSVAPPPAPVPTPAPEPANQDLYVIMNQVGEGTFGKVYKARNTTSKIYVALKRIRMESEKDGFPVTAMREIKLLQSLKHPNVVRLYEMMVSKGSVFMVFEYMDHDLTGILSQTQFKFSEGHLKSLCHQMLAGLAYLHHKGVIHRDIKGSNILLNNKGELKLADFGLARFYQKRRRTDYTNRVITLWYRPPELLFGATVYGAEVDMWSAGCIMLELFTKKPVFQGNDEIHQLHVIFKVLGTPTPDRWPGLSNLPWYELIRPKEFLPNRFREFFQKWMSPTALDLAEQLLNYDPERRISAQDALQAPFFTQEQPMPELPSGLSELDGEWHELETKQERMKKRKKMTESAAA